MRTISVQKMPDGFEVETPSFGYWFKAGVAFTAGAGVCMLVGWTLSAFLTLGVIGGALRAFGR
jgi:hypothetical protein